MKDKVANIVIIFILLFGFCGCENERNLLVKPVLCSADPNFTNSTELIVHYYPYLNLIHIEPNSLEYHADRLINTYRTDNAARHIIAIGILKQDTAEVRKALIIAANRFRDEHVPEGYDWPDLSERFKSHFDPSAPILDNYPGSRNLTFIDLIVECSYYLGCQSYIMSEMKSIMEMQFDPNIEFDTLQFLSQQ